MAKVNWKTKAQEITKKNEGLRLKLYKCPAGKLTIGYGHNIEDNGISENTANFLFSEDFNDCLRVAEDIFGKSLFSSFKDEAKIVIIDMLFNLGSTRFLSFKKFIRCLRVKDYLGASKEIENSKAYKQNTKRYKELVKLMAGGENVKK